MDLKMHNMTTNKVNNRKSTYTAHVTAIGGRNGRITSSDGVLDLDLALVDGLGKADQREGTNPEQLFAGAYAACFETSLLAIAQLSGITIGKSSVTASVSLYKGDAGFFLGAELEVSLPDLAQAEAQTLIDKAHSVCPYSKSVAGNVDVNIRLV
jgi:lipoyl-dependent peroxiredoxin